MDLVTYISMKNWGRLKQTELDSSLKIYKCGLPEAYSVRCFDDYDSEPKEESYDMYKNRDERLTTSDGRRRKEYFLVESSFFNEVISDIQQNPESGYKTCVDELLKSGYVPKEISAMVSFGGRKEVKIEPFASKVLNFYGIPTVACVGAYGSGESQKYFNYFNVSMDFVGGDEKFITFSDYIKEFCDGEEKGSRYISNGFSSLLKNLRDVFETHWDKVAEWNPEYALTEEQRKDALKKNEEDLAYNYLVRRCALGDFDFNAKNMGVLINEKTKDISFAPNFDFEGCCFAGDVFGFNFRDGFLSDGKWGKEFRTCFSKWVQCKNVGLGNFDIKNLSDDWGVRFSTMIDTLYYEFKLKEALNDVVFIANNYPNAVNRFCDKTEEILNSGKLDEYIDGVDIDWQIDDYKSDNRKTIKDSFFVVKSLCEEVASVCSEDILDGPGL